jgi:hypothetical protein
MEKISRLGKLSSASEQYHPLAAKANFDLVLSRVENNQSIAHHVTTVR